MNWYNNALKSGRVSGFLMDTELALVVFNQMDFEFYFGLYVD